MRIDFQTATPLSLLPANTNKIWVMARRMREVNVIVFGAMFVGTKSRSLSARGDHMSEYVMLSFPPEYLKVLKFYTPWLRKLYRICWYILALKLLNKLTQQSISLLLVKKIRVVLLVVRNGWLIYYSFSQLIRKYYNFNIKTWTILPASSQAQQSPSQPPRKEYSNPRWLPSGRRESTKNSGMTVSKASEENCLGKNKLTMEFRSIDCDRLLRRWDEFIIDIY